MHQEPILIRNARTITPYRFLKDSSLLLEGGKVVKVSENKIPEVPRGVRVIDAKNNIVTPGFIDIHLHGGGGADTMDATYEALNTISVAHSKGGTTTIVPSTVSAPIGNIINAINSIRASMQKGVDGAKILGVHIEGPYLSLEQKGAHDEKYVRNPSSEEIEKLLEHVDIIKNFTAAPELEGGLDLGKMLSSKGVLMSIGHSNATIYEVMKAVEAGYRHVTHLYSGCSMVRRIKAYRYPGVVEATYLIDELTAEMIADGKHLPPSLIKLILKNKGFDKINIVTDAMRAAGLPPGKYMLGEIEAIVDEGVAWLPDRSAFAGSVSIMSSMVKVLVEQVNLPLEDVVRLATINPAKFIKIDDRKGSLVEGKDADVVIFDRDLNVLSTIVEGRIVYESSKL